MHTLRIIVAGLLVLALFLGAARLIGGPGKAPLAKAALWFLPIWLAAALANMWVGVTQAGYTVAQETPITLVVFAVPAAVALLVRRLWLRA